MSDSVTHTGKVWLWNNGKNPASWYFLSIDGEAAEAIAAHEAIRRLELGRARGFGSVKVTARIGESTWNTSVFPSKEQGGYGIPLKASLRKAEGIEEGSEVSIELELL